MRLTRLASKVGFTSALAAFALSITPDLVHAQTGWDENTSTVTPVLSPAARMAFDSRRGVSVFYGGFPTAQTWEYDGLSWTLIPTLHSPGDRVDHSLTYDSVRRVVVLFGGGNAGTTMNDTWEFDGNDWTIVPTIGAPSLRDRADFVFDPVGARCVLIGGRLVGAPNEVQTWQYVGSTGTWSQIPTPVAPTSNWLSWVAYDSWNHRTLLYGGADASFTAQRDLWQFDNATDT